jgi:hypothetical protein
MQGTACKRLGLWGPFLKLKDDLQTRLFHPNVSSAMGRYIMPDSLHSVPGHAVLCCGRACCSSSVYQPQVRFTVQQQHGLDNYIDIKAKCRQLKKLTCKGTLRQVFICLRRPLLGFCLGRSSNFVGPESGQIQCVEYGLQQNSTTTTPSQPHS